MRKHYVLDWIQYVECTTCREMRCVDAFNKAKKWLFGKRAICKECEKEYRLWRSEENKEYLKNYYRTNREEMLNKHAEYREKNRDRIREREKEYYHRNSEKIKQKRKEWTVWVNMFNKIARQKSKYLISKLWIKPNICPICWKDEFSIEAHHPDYNKWNEIVFCCKSCHLLIHSWRIKCPKTIDLLTYKKTECLMNV